MQCDVLFVSLPTSPIAAAPGSAYINLGVILANNNRLEDALQVWKDGLSAWSA
jgi:hypothetical protein